ncbi:MAG: phospholipase [Bacteroidetes bacterium]|nr:phospholipase [Fibrella sp.]
MKSLFKIRSYLLTLLLVGYLAGCKTNDTPQPAANQVLVSSSLVTETSRDDLRARAALINPTIALLLQQGIKVRKLVYKTKNWDGSDIQASGLLIIPATTNAVPMISQQHGTITDDASAPSNYSPSSEAYLFSSIFASLGYILVCPDYIGYGASSNVPHNYEHRATLASASLDMLRAAREYIATDASINWDKRLYMTGYSEGGFATMSLYKKMQDEAPTEFNIRAVSCGAGAYDKTSFMRDLLTKPSSGELNANRSFLWVLLTYDSVYKLNRPLSSYFKEPYLTQITSQRLNAPISVSFDQVLTDSFKQGILSGTDTAFLNAVADNNAYDWKPNSPLLLTHGTADTQVYFLNSQNAYDAMLKRGASTTTVRLTSVPNGTHASVILPWLEATFTQFTTTP